MVTKYKYKSNYKIRLVIKQKLKKHYGVSEKKLRKYFFQAKKNKNSKKSKLSPMIATLLTLESRLDNQVYKARLAPNRRAARQLITHGHVTLNGKKIKSPGYISPWGVIIALRKDTNIVFTKKSPRRSGRRRGRRFIYPRRRRKRRKRTKIRTVRKPRTNIKKVRKPRKLILSRKLRRWVTEFYALKSHKI